MAAGVTVVSRTTPVRRALMVEYLRQIGIADERVLAAIAAVPREAFVPRQFFHQAYEDFALEIGEGQTISQPSVVARIVELAKPSEHDRALEIGTGSGYLTAVLAQLARFVFSVERFASLAQAARGRLEALAIRNVSVHVMDGSLGWRAHAPFEMIVVSAAAPGVPASLREQLADGGRLVIPIGDLRRQELVLVSREGERFTESRHGDASFVPLVGCQGFGGSP